MSDDRFERAAKTALVGVVKMSLPGSGLVLDVFKAIVGDKDAAFQRTLVGELHDHVNRLQNTVDRLDTELRKQGSKVEELDAVARAHVLNQFVQDISQTPGLEKRDAITNGTARQFDPRVGRFSFRQLWLQQLREMSDLEVEALKLHSLGAVSAQANEAYLLIGAPNDLISVKPGEHTGKQILLGQAEVAAMRLAIDRLASHTPALVTRTLGNRATVPDTVTIISPTGRSILELITEPAETSPMPATDAR